MYIRTVPLYLRTKYNVPTYIVVVNSHAQLWEEKLGDPSGLSLLTELFPT